MKSNTVIPRIKIYSIALNCNSKARSHRNEGLAFCSHLPPARHRPLGPLGIPGSGSSHGDTALGGLTALQGKPPRQITAKRTQHREVLAEACFPRGPRPPEKLPCLGGPTATPASSVQTPGAPSRLLAPLSHVTYLPEEEGSETAWTMSVDRASKMLVRNSFFLEPGQPKKIKYTHFFSYFTQPME